MFSCAIVVMRPKCSCTASNRWWMARPSQIMEIGRSSIGSRAIRVSRTSMWSMNSSANVPPAIVLVRYITAGPAAMRTAERSLVSRAIRSPVRARAKYSASSDSRRANRSFRRSYSIQRLTLFSVSRIMKRRKPPTRATPSIAPTSSQILDIGALLMRSSTASRRNHGPAVEKAYDRTVRESPKTILPR